MLYASVTFSESFLRCLLFWTEFIRKNTFGDCFMKYAPESYFHSRAKQACSWSLLHCFVTPVSSQRSLLLAIIPTHTLTEDFLNSTTQQKAQQPSKQKIWLALSLFIILQHIMQLLQATTRMLTMGENKELQNVETKMIQEDNRAQQRPLRVYNEKTQTQDFTLPWTSSLHLFPNFF